jgi:hypothetical protein
VAKKALFWGMAHWRSLAGSKMEKNCSKNRCVELLLSVVPGAAGRV